MEISPSFWEVQSWIKGIDIGVIGSGIVGLNAAIRAKELFPKSRVVVLERGSFPTGASTRNAGFACFGSVTELLDDLEERSMDEVMQTVAWRWKGLALLRSMLGDQALGYEHYGSYELFTQDDEASYGTALSKLEMLNQALEGTLHERQVFSIPKNASTRLGLSQIPHLIYNKLEGQLDTGKMMRSLLGKAMDLGIEIWNGVEVLGMTEKAGHYVIFTRGFTLEVGKLVVATNAFTPQLLPELDVKPSRNQVIITGPISGLRLKGCFHYNKGYGYLRNVGNRVLIGGWRHLDMEKEEVNEFGETPVIQEALSSWLRKFVLKNEKFEIEHRWSGILGTGNHKHPIVKRLGERLVVAVRLGGMGVAIGTSVGRKAAELLLE